MSSSIFSGLGAADQTSFSDVSLGSERRWTLTCLLSSCVWMFPEFQKKPFCFNKANFPSGHCAHQQTWCGPAWVLVRTEMVPRTEQPTAHRTGTMHSPSCSRPVCPEQPWPSGRSPRPVSLCLGCLGMHGAQATFREPQVTPGKSDSLPRMRKELTQSHTWNPRDPQGSFWSLPPISLWV